MDETKGNLPQSIIKGSGFINTDLEFQTSGGKILFISPKCTVIGFRELPYMLFSTPEFEEKMPISVKEKIHYVRKIILKATFSDETLKDRKPYDIPNWLIDFNMVECIDFDGVNLENLSVLSNLSIDHLIFRNVKFDNKEEIMSAFRLFKNLSNIECDKDFYSYFGNDLREINLNITLISEEV